MATTHKIS